MSNCPKCGTEVNEGIGVCPNCGSEIRRKISGLSIAAFVCSLTGCFSLVGIILAIVDLCMGANDKSQKHGLSIAAIIIPIVLIFAWIVLGAFVPAFVKYARMANM